MPLNSQTKPSHPDKVKHLYFIPRDSAAHSADYSPYFYAEAKIDFNDIRTGFRETVSLSKALDIYSSNADLLWAEDMIQNVNPQILSSSAPDSIRLGGLPDFVDAAFISRMETQFVQYLMRSFAITIFRNFALSIYSFSGESKAEFAGRCRELCEGPKRKELDLLHDVFNRRLEQTKRKYFDASEAVGLEQSKTESQNKDLFSHYSERIAALFLRCESKSNPSTGPFHPPPGMQDLEERLSSLELEVQQTIAKLQDSYEEKARNLDEYILHPNLKDIHFVRSCILWMPNKAN